MAIFILLTLFLFISVYGHLFQESLIPNLVNSPFTMIINILFKDYSNPSLVNILKVSHLKYYPPWKINKLIKPI